MSCPVSARLARWVASYANAIRSLEAQLTKLGALNDDFTTNVVASATLNGDVSRKLVEFSVSAGNINACGDIFSLV
jgi:hypothetical protein